MDYRISKLNYHQVRQTLLCGINWLDPCKTALPCNVSVAASREKLFKTNDAELKQ